MPAVTVIEAPCGEGDVMVHPVGTDQEYEVAYLAPVSVYVCEVNPGH